jgi:hypothetical protein
VRIRAHEPPGSRGSLIVTTLRGVESVESTDTIPERHSTRKIKSRLPNPMKQAPSRAADYADSYMTEDSTTATYGVQCIPLVGSTLHLGVGRASRGRGTRVQSTESFLGDLIR